MKIGRGNPSSQTNVLVLAAFILAVANQCGAQVPCRYEVAAIIQAPSCGVSGPPPTSATGISPNGRYICGYWLQCVATADKAFLYDTQLQQFITLPFPSGVTSMRAEGVNDGAMVVGSMTNSVIDQTQGFIWSLQTGQYTILSPLSPHGMASANAINNSNTVCGYRSIGSRTSQNNPYQAFVWSAANGFTDLGIMVDPGSSAGWINQSGGVAGFAGHLASSDERGFTFLYGQLLVIPPIQGGVSSEAIAINDNAAMTIGGVLQFSPFATRLSIVKAGIWKELFPLSGDLYSQTSADGLSNDGTVLGASKTSLQTQTTRACLWRNGSAVELNTIVRGSGFTSLQFARAVSQTDRIAVNGVDLTGHTSVILLNPIMSIAGDTNCDQRVDIDDVVNIITRWGPCYGCDADQTRDALVNIDDLVSVIVHWNS